jgi:hypothetical protein
MILHCHRVPEPIGLLAWDDGTTRVSSATATRFVTPPMESSFALSDAGGTLTRDAQCYRGPYSKQRNPAMAHIVLLGDSIFDNGPYVPTGGTTLDQLTSRLPDKWSARLLAVDGSVTSEVLTQLRKIPKTATHLVISSGGNDALGQEHMLYQEFSNAGEAFCALGTAARDFEQDYLALVQAAMKTGLPTIVCTIYNGNFPDPQESLATSIALTPFNDAIIRAAWASNFPIIDLRTVCDRPEHYANEIEPSTEGSARIAEAILRMIQRGLTM